MNEQNPDDFGHFIIHGLVQGVCFRASTMDMGRSLGLSGWVRNLPDGCVETMASGHAEALSKFKDWLHEGPPAARVESVEEFTVEAEQRTSLLPKPFEIRRY